MDNKSTPGSAAESIIIGQSPSAALFSSSKEIYEVLRVQAGIPLFLSDHLIRLKNSFKQLNLLPQYKPEELTHAIYHLIKIDKVINNNMKISCFVNTDGMSQYYIYSIPSSYPNLNTYTQGINTTLWEAERSNPNIKIGHTLVRETANQEIEKKHVHEVLLVNHDGLITEGSRSNVFFILGDTVYTAPSAIVLEGIIRKKTLEIIQREGIHLKMECISIPELSKVDAAFITGTSPRIMPIHKINETTLDVNNTILRELMHKLNHLIAAYTIP